MNSRSDRRTSNRLPLRSREGDIGTPRDEMERGSPEWCYRTLTKLKYDLERCRLTEAEYNKTLAELEEHRAWEKIPPERPYGDEDVMLKAEVGVTRAEGTAKVQELARDAKGPAKSGRPKKGEDATPLPKGAHSKRLSARIAAHHPEILARMKAGEFRSVRAAALEAGIVKRSVAVPIDPPRAARLLVKHFTAEGLDALLAEIERLRGEPAS